MFGIDSLHLTTIVGVLIGALIVNAIVRALNDPLKDVPGPWITRFTSFWYLRRAANGSFPWTNIDLHRDLGPVVRLAPHEYSIDDPDAAKIIYSADSKFYKAPWYDGWRPPNPQVWEDLFSTRDPKIHSAHKRILGPFYTMSNWSRMESGVNETTKLLLARLMDLAKNGKEFDLQHWLQCYAFDTIMLITVNKRFGFLDTGDDKGMFQGIEQFNTIATSGGFFPRLFRPFMLLLWYLNLPSPIDTAVQIMDAEVERHQVAYKAQSNGKPLNPLKGKDAKDVNLEDGNILTQAMAKHFTDPEKLPIGAIHTMGMQNLGAGSDTTSISLSSTIHQLSMAPKILQNLRSEIAKARKDNDITQVDNLPFAIAQKMSYLQAVLKEATRLHAATGLPMSRIVPEGGATLAGTFFPAGTTVGINSWVAHYNSSVYGDDPAEFRPERWLPFQTFSLTPVAPDDLTKAEKDRLALMDHYYLAFGRGSRSCVGRNISMLEISKVVPELVWRFDFVPVDFSPVDQNGKIRRDLGGRDGSGLQTRGTWFVKQTNLKYRVKLRS